MEIATGEAKPQAEAAVRYQIDTKRSTFTIQAFSTGLLSAFGHNPRIAARDVQGDVTLAMSGGTLQGAALHLGIRADSLEVIDDISAKDRQEIERQMKQDVLDTGHYPEILYECSKVTGNGNGDRFGATLQGELTLHGETHSQSVSARVVISGDSLRASGEFTVRQSGYGIAPVKVAGGAIKLKDEVKCTFDIAARKQE